MDITPEGEKRQICSRDNTIQMPPKIIKIYSEAFVSIVGIGVHFSSYPVFWLASYRLAFRMLTGQL